MPSTHGWRQSNAKYTRMPSQVCERIHMASLEILERVGIDVHSKEAREVLGDHGADVDGLRVCIPGHMVEQALDLTPAYLTLCDRKGEVAIRAWGYNTAFGGGSDCLYVLDHRSGRRRRAVLEDVEQAVTVMDALPQFDFVMSGFLPSDVDQRVYHVYQMATMLSHTTKPIVFVTPDFEGCVTVVEMCEIVAGGEDAFRHSPFATCYINVTSGLVANEEALQKCMYLARKGLPMLYIPINAAGVNSPTTTAGCMATMNAGTMLGLVLAQLVRPGTPVAVPGWNGGPYNLKTMVGNYVLADEQGVAASMGKFYNLPVFGLGGATDSKALDQQCAAEAALGLFNAHLSGANIIHDCGFMDAGLQGSLQLMAIDNELIAWIRAATGPVQANEDMLALDVIEELGPTGDYLSHDHTYAHFKDAHYAHLADKRQYDSWMEQGGTTMEERARVEVDDILRNHRPEPLSTDVEAALRDIIQREKANLS